MTTKITPSSSCVFADLGIEKPAVTDAAITLHNAVKDTINFYDNLGRSYEKGEARILDKLQDALNVLEGEPIEMRTSLSEQDGASMADIPNKMVELARDAYNNVYDAELHASGRYTDNQDAAMRAAIAAVISVFSDQPESDECRCIACAKPLNAGDMVLLDIGEGGLIHAECCGPERENYCDADGEPLAADAPIPTPFPYDDGRKATAHPHPVEMVQADVQPVAWRWRDNEHQTWNFVDFDPMHMDYVHVEPLYSQATVAALKAEHLRRESELVRLLDRADESRLSQIRRAETADLSLAECQREKEGLRETAFRSGFDAGYANGKFDDTTEDEAWALFDALNSEGA